MKPSYATLKKNHYSSNDMNPSYVGAIDAYQEVGYDINELIKQNPGYVNTCALRMSLALLKSGVQFTGRLRIKTGEFTGRSFEPGAKLLADQLKKESIFGMPKLLNRENALKYLVDKKGVILFWKIDGYNGGHIDLIESTTTAQVCNSACYFACKEIWFWQLN
ncbi:MULTISPECIES: T6SS effector amidase Tae4 family protein [unclassified Arsukibacterium]|jgi:hypothetical protein|uniref:T6SS effector amidase Tae4 family protein n=1 Tax=unclassified Arsukibacterium TaxID=2635278 RepID=UPI000C51CD7C|nr:MULTISPECIES: T6SS effector amidase Tae4 family protein [unclassified Arsukibacterium]MAA94975.1 hypothetical protein [Rheinheimera sp.]MBM33529.1 hypothetical protein [Rheinheimera sp.]HAW92363.1 hypothetical protein [Candidatus Azambacteria bacterium]|tara:strand:+ start:263327 stop:263815 length:489 start_codon:yes stop_codon:yes gene_type:complete